MNKSAVHHITETLGSEAIQARLGVRHSSVRRARWLGAFPGDWYGQLKPMCDEVGIPCPMSAFNWRASSADRGAA